MQSKQPRRPGELVFNIAMAAGSLFLLWSAYGISGFEALSAPGTVPMLVTAIMLVCAIMILRETLRKSSTTSERLAHDILPMPVIVTIVLIIAYAILLQPLGFLPTSFLFLTGLIGYLSRRPIWSAVMSLAILAVIYLVFRLVFHVLMPEGIVPEGEIIAGVKALFAAKGN